ncbi:porin family protein [Chryseobacterium pennipullorum]|uniref:Outer membrane protein beta-barrel domain-containing protein n=1 Tax=Chryseobacterium pennipullorum TaxID=2258963 RepID=A0A3D9B1U3_9FLAO|nr:porin family protein [Chryseobacterium pennipullorum]REC47287.1 hypothetical protein DRF67_11765 [Chryseobacterium pennipullorum]
MKNIFFVLLLAAFTSFNAQSSSMSFGIKGGYNLSSMKFFDEKSDSKSYFYVGALAEQALSPKFAVQAEVLYTQLGGKESYPWVEVIGNEVVNVGDMNFEYQLNQVQIPVSAKYYVIPAFSVSAGMNFGINVSTKVKSSNEFTGTNKQNFEWVKSVNFFPFLGAEYKINDKFFVDARYNFNFIEVSKENSVPMKIGFLQAGLGYRFK